MTCQHHWTLNNDNPPVGVCLKCDAVREFPTPDQNIKYGGWTRGAVRQGWPERNHIPRR